MLEHQLSFFFSAVGVFNGMLAWLYLQFFTRPRTTVHTLGCLILLMFCIRVGVSCVYFFTPGLSPHLIQLGLSANYMIGPLMLAFATLHLNPEGSRDKLTVLHHVVINALIITVFGLIYQFKDHFFIWDHRIRYVIHTHLTIYLLFTAYHLRIPIKKLFSKPDTLKTYELETLAVFLLTVVICLGFVVALYTNYIIGPVFTSIVFYGVTLGVFTGRKRIQQFLEKASKYKNKKMGDDVTRDLTARLERLMDDEALYKTPNLKIEDLAERMHVGINVLSQFINDRLGQNYPSLINTYRIREAQRLISHQETDHLTIEAIGYEVGFNSKSAFYAAFKKQTGMSPSAYRKQHRNS